jgi:serine-type D-Ala-D-Ala carboxypeptidase/endopeptidase
MIQRRYFLLGAIASSVLVTQARAELAPDDEIRSILQDRVDNARQSIGIVASSFAAGRQKLVVYGRCGAILAGYPGRRRKFVRARDGAARV